MIVISLSNILVFIIFASLGLSFYGLKSTNSNFEDNSCLVFQSLILALISSFVLLLYNAGKIFSFITKYVSIVP